LTWTRRWGLLKLFTSFPDGWPGCGLLLLRLTVAFSSFGKVASLIAAPGTQSIGSWSVGLLGVLIGTALLLGILTPVAGALAALSNLCNCVFWVVASGAGVRGNVVITVYLIIMSIVVVFLGPGAFSLDAYLFGPREIVIPEAPRSRDS
jgi:uncharacterized membrane protein YphA (DoxX/SURF4 family)